MAVRCGGKDYATKDIRGMDFSGLSLINKENNIDRFTVRTF
jgi:hypothetical protein